MPDNIVPIDDYSFALEESIFIDANIWLSIHGIRPPDDPRVEAYSNVLKRMLESKCCIYTHLVVISEFINMYARYKHRTNKDFQKKFRNFKEFRNSEEFLPISKEAAESANDIIKLCTCLDITFDSNDIKVLLAGYQSGHADFNDWIYVEICKRYNLKLLTDDNDFIGQDIFVLTNNKRLLS